MIIHELVRLGKYDTYQKKNCVPYNDPDFREDV